MSLESDLYTLLAAQCSRVYPDVGPQNTARPYVTYQQIGGASPAYLERTVVDRRNALMQVNVWADTRLAANTLALAIESALTQATTLQATASGALLALHEPDTGLYGCIQRFSIWAAR